ncbi:hypothetical protein Tco_0867407 [Tanacetum coccineum]
MPTEMKLVLEQTQQGIYKDRRGEHAEYDESNTYVLKRFNTSAGNPVKEIPIQLNLLDHMSILINSKSLGALDLGSQVEFHREIHDLNFRGSSCKNLFVLSSSNRGRLLGFTDLMRQKNKRMKQEGLIQHYGILEDLKSNSSYLLI